jgi:hypothetical protein
LFLKVVGSDLGAAEASSRPTAVVVLGMHRSGTSSVAGALVRRGGTAPRHLMPAAPDNPRGFWESTVLTALNDDILAAGGSEWADWRRFELDRIDPAQAAALRERAKAALIAEFGGASVPIVKDPRMCRLMGFWQPVFDELGWSTRVVLPVRSPLEVAWSLRQRDNLGVGAGRLLWLRHVLDAEAETRGVERTVIEWSRFLRDWPASLRLVAERLDLRLNRWDSRGIAEVEEFLSPDLRRFTAGVAEFEADPTVAALVCDAYAAILDLTDGFERAETLRRIDALRARFEEAVRMFDPLIREHERVAEALAHANAFIARYALGTPPKTDVRPPLTRSPPRTVERRDLRTIRDSPFFDEAFYVLANPDVGATGGDAALHFLVQGWREGRDPGPFFSTKAYLARNPDVATAGMNPLVHYETHGRKEDRPAIG